jgi:hypothetical protein
VVIIKTLKWGEPPAGTADPITQGGTIQHHALTGEDLGLAIQRQRVAIFADQDVRQQRLGRHAAINRPFRSGRLDDCAFAGPAAVSRSADHLHPYLSRHVIQHFRMVLADDMHGAATARTGFVLDIDNHFYPGEMRRQRATVALRRLALWRSGRGVRLWC